MRRKKSNIRKKKNKAMGLYDQKENYFESSDIFGSSLDSFCSKG